MFEQQDHLLASASLGYVEVAAALVRQQEARKLPPEVIEDALATLEANWHEFFQVELTRDIADFAFSLARKWRLRGADAMHLAAAEYLRQKFGGSDLSIVLVASDEELLAAAQAIGFDIINPVSKKQEPLQKLPPP